MIVRKNKSADMKYYHTCTLDLLCEMDIYLLQTTESQGSCGLG